jgi:magnesium transporter
MRTLDRLDPAEIHALHGRGEFFWLDLEAPSDAELAELAELLQLPPLAAEDSRELNQRPKIDDYGDRLLIVFYGAHGAPDDPRLFELHMHLSGRELVTIHQEVCPPLEAARAAHLHTDQEIVYRVLDALSESTLTLLRAVEEDVVAIEQRAFERPSPDDRRLITRMRGQLFRLMQIIVPQKDMLAENAEAVERVLSLEPGQVHHPFSDVRDDLVQAANLIAYCREVLGEALHVHLQATSNRLNEIATRLTLLATFFVPLTLITSYFGMNFGWLVNHIDSLGAYLIWGVGAMVVPCIGVWLWLRRAGYLNSDGQ